MHRPRQWITALLAAALLSGCSVQNRPRQQFAGRLTSAVAGCPVMSGTLVIQRQEVVFAPGDGTWVLSGKLEGDIVRAEKSRPGLDHKNYQTTPEAHLQNAEVVGTYTTPTCSYQIDLKQF